MRLKSEEETKLFLIPADIDMIIHIIILYLLNLLTTLDLDLNILSLISIFNYFWNLGENPVQPSTPRKKKTRKPGKKTSSWFAKQNKLLTSNGSSTCSEIHGYTIDRLHVLDEEIGNLGENPVQPSTPRKKKTRKPGKKISSWFAKQNKLLTSNGSSTCSEIHGYTIDRLYVLDEEIGKGINGTVVFKGRYEGREVAVKRFLKTLDNEALKQVQHLVKSDHHPNIVRLHGVKRDNEYVYLVLEHCFCSLSDLVSHSAKETGNQTPLKTTKQYINLWKSNGYPSALLLKLMRDMVHGLVHLQELGIIHEDITPQNVMIAKGLNCAKLSEIGVSKHLISGKNATDSGSSRHFPPKQKHQRWPADMFSLGYVFYFCLSRGGRPSANQLQDDIDIGNNTMSLKSVYHIPEAVNLLSRLLHPNPKRRPNAKQVLQHPLFWDSERRMYFLRDVSDRLQRERKKCPSKFLVAMEGVGIRVFGARWDEKMDQELVKDINRCRRYQKKSVKNLLRAVRNLLNHYHEVPKEIQELLGSSPEGLDSYFSCRFPRLLMEVYKVVFCYCRSEKTFERYFRVN